MLHAKRCVLFGLLLTASVALLVIVLAGPGDDDAHRLPRRVASPARARPAVSVDKGLATDRSTRILNLTDFRLVLDAKCNYSAEEAEDWQLDAGGAARAVWIVTSYAGDVTQRSALRRAYGSEELEQLGVRRVFLLGTLDELAQGKTGVSQRAIEDEARRFRDIVQGNFVEAYKNLTYKHLMGLQWAAERCSDSYTYIMKMDDDIVINLYEALELLKNKSNTNVQDDFLMGYVLERMVPVRNKANKWFVTEEEFPNAVYPTFLSGWFYITDVLTALKLVYQSKQHSDYFWIDDLFITGILRKEAGIKNFINVQHVFTSDYRFLECCLRHREKLPKYKCDFIVGPDGAQANLLLTFKTYSKDCYQKYNCTSRPTEQLLKNKCILDYRNSNLGSGNAQIESLP